MEVVEVVGADFSAAALDCGLVCVQGMCIGLVTAQASWMLTPQGTVALPVRQLLDLLTQGRRILGLSVTPTTHEVVSLGPPFSSPHRLSTGTLLTPEQLTQLVDQQDAGALVLGGTALFKADGTTHYGVRKLISGVLGVSYDKGDWLPQPKPAQRVTPILLCRGNHDDPTVMITQYIKRHAGQGSFPASASHSQVSSSDVR